MDSAYWSMVKRFPELFDNSSAPLQIILDPREIEDWQVKRESELNSKNLPLEWAKIGVLINDPFFVAIRDLVRFPNGETRGYSRVVAQAHLAKGRAVVILPEYQGKYLLLHQYRHTTRSWHYEIPRGFGEADISAEENASKEVEEETGGSIAELIGLGELHNNTGFEAHPVSLFYAKLAKIGKPDINEGIRDFVLLNGGELEAWILNNKVTDGFTIAAYTKAKLKNLIL